MRILKVNSKTPAKINKVYGDKTLNWSLARSSLCLMRNRIYGIGIVLKYYYGMMLNASYIYINYGEIFLNAEHKKVSLTWQFHLSIKPALR